MTDVVISRADRGCLFFFFTGFCYRVLLGSLGFVGYGTEFGAFLSQLGRVLLGFTGFYLILLGFTGFYQVLLVFT